MKKLLITGGAGFVGTNLVDNLLNDGHQVIIFDALKRRGTEHNLAWLQKKHADKPLAFVHDDIRNFEALKNACKNVDVIYHLAGQVAVTSSVENPREDFEVNALGTFNVLEAARVCAKPPIVIFTSTNKVYGGMEDVRVDEKETRYEYHDFPDGISETQPLDFHSPYGCSKGAADQYVRDYARIYGLKTVVFRMSCIYGPHQFGNEDQGWLAHFMIAALMGQPISIYGDGKQIRDILYVEDLVRALRLGAEKIDTIIGEIFNIGGGPTNTLSVWQEFKTYLAELKGEEVPVSFNDWRPGDQPVYVSDIRKVRERLNWQPQIDKATGIAYLWNWIKQQQSLFEELLKIPRETEQFAQKPRETEQFAQKSA